MIAPAVFSDCDGSYRGADGLVHSDPGHETYTIFSLWDTYRAAMPLYSIIDSGRYSDFVNTMLDIYDEQGKLPVWHLHGCETNCMVGNPAIPAVADAIVKGLKGFDYQRAYEAMKASAMLEERGQGLRMKYGYIPCDLMAESVAFELEYALADGALARAAQVLGKDEDREYFTARSHSYRHLFDPQLGFIRGKDSKGNFRKDYNPFFAAHRTNDYCEGNGWQYTWLAPHDLEGLVGCFGSEEAFLSKLDSLFVVPSELEDGASPDISGMIGQYAHGNEPSHHILYYYTMLGYPQITYKLVSEVLENLYSDKCDGLSGNEDVGQMSAWYILSSLGFYEVEPASGRYWLGCPSFERAVLKVDGGEFVLETQLSKETSAGGEPCVRRAILNGRDLERFYITHEEIAAGGHLKLIL